LKKLNINPETNAHKYAIVECATLGTERYLNDNDVLYDVMQTWHDKQTFMFKRRKDEKIIDETDPKPEKPKQRANKLAGFFGAEVDMMLKALNTMSSDTNGENIPELKTRVSFTMESNVAG
jgi:hypothetical protein